MLTTLFGKKRVTEDKLANIFVNSLIDIVEQGFADVAGLINEDPEFVLPPQLKKDDSDKLMMIVLVGNLKQLSYHFENDQGKRMEQLIIEKFSKVYDIDVIDFSKLIADYKTFMARVNHPSKNTLYAMSKAVFYKYDLNSFQEKYFKDMNTPNPIFLKRLDDIMNFFLWDWENFLDKYKVIG